MSSLIFILYWIIVDLQCVSFRCTYKVIQLYIYLFFFKLFSHLGYYKISFFTLTLCFFLLSFSFCYLLKHKTFGWTGKHDQSQWPQDSGPQWPEKMIMWIEMEVERGNWEWVSEWVSECVCVCVWSVCGERKSRGELVFELIKYEQTKNHLHGAASSNTNLVRKVY